MSGKDLIYRLYLTLNILISKINHVKKKTIFGKELEQKIFKNIGQESTSERQIDEEKCKYLTSATKTSNNLNFNIQNLLLGKFNFFNYGLNDNETCSRSVFSLFKTNSNFNEEVEFLLEFEESYVYLPSN
ncbi:hypothetical protein HK099_007563 [Clydaea vesicula]|uniref:Uncharacterized protein n=1 Tax=Clydaea vesicula TaxID=447962 RepID=A0AAD5TZX0_9FUNG|nr:hypothetical protein HK099_007563 [Clydaea vesicula]KAJ3396409.1 hypothetical protein HDU92_003031 [Lobulomyces angularis]